MKWINRLYIFFLGIILSITTGFGLAAFYPQPTSPSYPSYPTQQTVPQSCYATPQQQQTPECQQAYAKQQQLDQQNQQQQQKYDQQIKDYSNKSAGYTRTVVFFGLVIGAIFAMLGIVLIKKSKLVASGLLLAGVLTAILTRLLIMLASLGSSTTGTNGPDTTAYLEFGVLFILSVMVVVVGIVSLKDKEETVVNNPATSPNPAPVPTTNPMK